MWWVAFFLAMWVIGEAAKTPGGQRLLDAITERIRGKPDADDSK